jgi:DNA-binding GntR family transcriptional regulator
MKNTLKTKVNPAIPARRKNRIRIPARHQARQKIQDMILSGTCRPGDRLGQQELAKKCGVAQGVIREALLELQIGGLVEVDDNRGAFVGSLGAGMIVESIQIRGMLEGLAARLCCRRITREQIKSLEEHARTIYNLSQENRQEKRGMQDRLFHQRLIEIAGNRMLQRLSENFWVLGKIIMGESKSAQVVFDEHMAILKAVELGQEKQAEMLMREHVGDLGEGVDQQIKDGTYTPKWILSV